MHGVMDTMTSEVRDSKIRNSDGEAVYSCSSHDEQLMQRISAFGRSHVDAGADDAATQLMEPFQVIAENNAPSSRVLIRRPASQINLTRNTKDESRTREKGHSVALCASLSENNESGEVVMDLSLIGLHPPSTHHSVQRRVSKASIHNDNENV
jgi:hypothetical protein